MAEIMERLNKDDKFILSLGYPGKNGCLKDELLVFIQSLEVDQAILFAAFQLVLEMENNGREFKVLDATRCSMKVNTDVTVASQTFLSDTASSISEYFVDEPEE